MPTKKISSPLLFALVAVVLIFANGSNAQDARPYKIENVILVMIDGMRWQEVFRGADPELLKTLGPDSLGSSRERATEAQKKYGYGTGEERRKALMPFLWNTIAREGQLFGNLDLGSDAHVINGLNFSYPGYAETLTGFVDARIHSNDNVQNPNPTVFEWLNKNPAFTGKVAAFGAWEVFDGIFASDRCDFPVSAGYRELVLSPSTPELALMNELKSEEVKVWPDEPFDPIPFHTAIEYLKIKKPRVLFLGLGETDDWAHADSYALYLDAAHLADHYIEELWNLIQQLPEYRGKTTLIVLPDHGRGDGAQWTDHGQDIPESKQTWMAFLGPDTPALGERKNAEVVTESQVAATIAALLGQDYIAAVPKASSPIGDVIATK